MSQTIPDNRAPITNVVVAPRVQGYAFVATTLSLACYSLNQQDTINLLWIDSTFGAPQNNLTWVPSIQACITATQAGLFVFDITQGNISALPIEGCPVSLRTFGEDQLVISTRVVSEGFSGWYLLVGKFE